MKGTVVEREREVGIGSPFKKCPEYIYFGIAFGQGRGHRPGAKGTSATSRRGKSALTEPQKMECRGGSLADLPCLPYLLTLSQSSSAMVEVKPAYYAQN